MEQPEAPREDRTRLSRLIHDHKLFSGFAGSALVAGIALIVAGGNNQGTTQVPPDGTQGSVASSPSGPGTQGEANPNEDGDGVPDGEDECPGQPGGMANGCPAVSGGLTLAAFIEKSDDAFFEGGEKEYLRTDNVSTEQVTVGGITDPLGVLMEIGEPEEAGAFTIATNRAFKTIEGRVGITTEPCSGGPVAYVAVRNSEGEPLWPPDGQLRRVRRNAVAFKVRIDSQDAVVLYAQAPEAKQSCNEWVGTTAIGWAHTRLIAIE
jgi:hypothetical protein